MHLLTDGNSWSTLKRGRDPSDVSHLPRGHGKRENTAEEKKTRKSMELHTAKPNSGQHPPACLFPGTYNVWIPGSHSPSVELGSLRRKVQGGFLWPNTRPPHHHPPSHHHPLKMTVSSTSPKQATSLSRFQLALRFHTEPQGQKRDRESLWQKPEGMLSPRLLPPHPLSDDNEGWQASCGPSSLSHPPEQ